MARDPALQPINAPRPFAPVEGLKLPAIASTADAMLEHALHRRLQPEGQPANALGQLQWLAGQLARIQHSSALPFDLLVFDAPQLVVFAAFSVQNLPSWVRGVAEEPLRQGALALVVAVTVLLVACTWIGERRLRAQGFDVDGRLPPGDSGEAA